MTRLFLSHASEDKDEIARPLADALRKKFEVWFDETELRAGDSLRNKIDCGLRNCDFGIVILSEAFFAKKWTNAELNGLFALEDLNRKVIMPVWHRISEARLKEVSPMLADRMALSSSKGIPRLVEDISLAVEAASRTQDVLSPSKAQRAMILMQEKLAGLTLDGRMFRSEGGVKLLLTSIETLGEHLLQKLQTLNPSVASFTKQASQGDGFGINGPLRVNVSVKCRNVFANSVSGSKIEVGIFLSGDEFDGSSPKVLDRDTWLFTCRSADELGFFREVDANRQDPKILTREELGDEILTKFCQRVSDQVAQRRSREFQ